MAFKQHEIEVSAPIVYTIECDCKKTDKRLVVMERAVDPAYRMGTCGRCKKNHIRKIK